MTTPTVASGFRETRRSDGHPAAVRVALPPGTALDPFATAGDSGIVFVSADRVLVGIGSALSLDLPFGLA